MWKSVITWVDNLKECFAFCFFWNAEHYMARLCVLVSLWSCAMSVVIQNVGLALPFAPPPIIVLCACKPFVVSFCTVVINNWFLTSSQAWQLYQDDSKVQRKWMFVDSLDLGKGKKERKKNNCDHIQRSYSDLFMLQSKPVDPGYNRRVHVEAESSTTRHGRKLG